MPYHSMVDWEAVKRRYRAGQLSVREIAHHFGCSHTAIQKRAKKLGWERDLTEAVKKAVARKRVARIAMVANLPETATDEEIVEVVSSRGAEIEDSHRRDIRKSQEIVNILQEQLQIVIDTRAEIEAAIEEETTRDDGTPEWTRRHAMMKAIALPAHVACIEKLSSAQKNLIGLERQTFGLNSGIEDDGEDSKITKIHIEFIQAKQENIHTQQMLNIRKE